MSLWEFLYESNFASRGVLRQEQTFGSRHTLVDTFSIQEHQSKDQSKVDEN
jgi:hypothetical protein